MPDQAEYNDLVYNMAGVRRRNPYDAKRSFAMGLAQQGMDSSPVQSPWQGVNRLAQALVGAYGMYKADTEEKDATKAYESKLALAMAEPDPQKRMAGLSSLGGSGGLQAAIAGTSQELATKRKRADDMEAASFLLGGGGPQQAGGGVPGRSAPADLEPHFQAASQQTGLPMPLIKAVAGTESEFNPNAVSPAGAGGVMQITPGTAGDLGVTNRFDPAQSITKGSVYLKQQMDKYGSLPTALIAYNWGPGNTDNWLKQGGDPSKLPAETRSYVQKVQARMGGGSLPQGSADGSGTPSPPQQSDPGMQYEEAARRAHAAGRGDIAMAYMQKAVQAREAAAVRDQGRTLQHVDLGDSVGILDPRTGSIVRRIPKGKKPGAGEGGAFGGTGMENQARSALVKAAQNPAFAQSPEYAAAYGFLSKPRLDMATGMQLPPEDLSRFPQPSYGSQGGQQQAPQQMAPNAAPPLVGPSDFGAPPAPNPNVVGGPSVVAQPPGGGITATPIQGMPAKEANIPEWRAKAQGMAARMITANALLDDLAIQGTSARGRFMEALPGGIGEYGKSPEFQRFEQAKRNFMNAQLRDESGAVIGPSEFMSADKQYFPQPGQETNKELHAQMAENRRQVVEAMMLKAGLLKQGQRYEPPKAEKPPPETGAPTEYDYVNGKLVPRK